MINYKWINVKDAMPDYIEGEDFSENVFTTDGKDIFIMSRYYDYDAEGWMWANCYGRIDGDGEIDDDYSDMTHWMPLPSKDTLKALK